MWLIKELLPASAAPVSAATDAVVAALNREYYKFS
jgi:hypothetical protein